MLHVAITVGGGQVGLDQILLGSGINQNIAYLAMLLTRLSIVDEVSLCDCASNGGEPHPLAQWLGLACVSPEEAVGKADIVIELGARLPGDIAYRMRDKKQKVVSYMAGNVLAMNFEALACALPHGEILSEMPFDAVWITPQHWHMNRSYAVRTRSSRVYMAPHIWAPSVVERQLRAGNADYFWTQPTDGWRLGIFEPNVNVLKTFHIAMLACEEAYRLSPGDIGAVLAFNSSHLKETDHFREFAAALDIFRDAKLFAEARLPTVSALGRHIDAVVTHQWQNHLNYLYWDVLYSGRPLIHNVPTIEAGYYYEAFDPADGGRAIVDAVKRHAAEAAQYRRHALEAVWQFHIDNPVVLLAHADLIEQVMTA
jgi:hypothetical protein